MARLFQVTDCLGRQTSICNVVSRSITGILRRGKDRVIKLKAGGFEFVASKPRSLSRRQSGHQLTSFYRDREDRNRNRSRRQSKVEVRDRSQSKVEVKAFASSFAISCAQVRSCRRCIEIQRASGEVRRAKGVSEGKRRRNRKTRRRDITFFDAVTSPADSDAYIVQRREAKRD